MSSDRHGELHHGGRRHGVLRLLVWTDRPEMGRRQASVRLSRAKPRNCSKPWQSAGTSFTPTRISRRRWPKSIKEQAVQKGLGELFEQVLVPTEEVIEMRRGRKIKSERRFFPGLCAGQDGTDRRGLSPDQEHAEGDRLPGFRITSRFRFPMPKPTASSTRWLRVSSVPKSTISFEIGEQVRVADGPFASFNGQVEEVDEERARLKVAVSIFGRPTPVELEYGQVEKMKCRSIF